MIRLPGTRRPREQGWSDLSDQIEGRYAPQARRLLGDYDVRVYRWRTSMSGHALLGHSARLIAAPHPRSPLSFAILAHEVGHHALGKVRPRWREEYLAWDFALHQMDERDVPITAKVLERQAASLRYALAKALRRGLREIPPELTSFLPD